MNKFQVFKKLFFYFLLLNINVVISQTIMFNIKNDSINSKFSLRSITNEVLETIKVKENNFKIDTHLDEGYYLLKKDNKEVLLYLKRNDEVTISFDSDNFYNSLVIRGDGANRNTYLLNRHKERLDEKGKIDEFYYKDFYKGSEDDYLKKLDALYKGFFSTVFSSNFDEKFVDNEMKNLQYAYSLDLLKFDEAKKYYKFNDSISASKYFLEPLTHIHFDNYELFKKYYSYKKLSTLKWKKDIDKEIGYKEMQEILSSIRTIPLRESILEELYRVMSKDNPKVLEFYYKLIKANSKNNQLVINSKEKYAEIKYLKAEKNLSKFKYLNSNDEEVNLSKFKGKYIFIHVWLSWNKGKEKYFAEIKKFRKEFTDDNIVFVNLFLGKKEKYNAWLNMLKENDVNWVQLFFNDSKVNFIRTYDISSFPNYFILSLKGEKMNTKIDELSLKKTGKMLKKLLK